MLDLGTPEARALVRDAAFLATAQPRTGEPAEPVVRVVVPQPGSFRVIMSVAGLIHFADLPLALEGITYLLHPDGELHLLEPIWRPGMSALLGASLTAGCSRWIPAIRGLHLNRDVAAAVRAQGLTIYDIERFPMPARTRPLREWMQARAILVNPMTARTGARHAMLTKGNRP